MQQAGQKTSTFKEEYLVEIDTIFVKTDAGLVLPFTPKERLEIKFESNEFVIDLEIVTDCNPNNRDNNGHIIELSSSHRLFKYKACITQVLGADNGLSFNVDITHNNPTLPTLHYLGMRQKASKKVITCD